MRKEIARLNEIIGKGCTVDNPQTNDKKKDEQKGPQYKQGRHPSIKHGLSHTKRSQDKWKEDSEWLWVCAVWEEGQNWYRSACIDRNSAAFPSNSAIVKGDSAAPLKNGKATNYVLDQTKPKKKVF